MALDAGSMSNAILKAAGKQIQTELNKKASKHVPFGKVIQTSGGNMTRIKAIYHGAVAGYNGGKGEKVEISYEALFSIK
jgi:O-acetyl-ADP-ribose deacetylase (regulator of RNase III)